ncbi:MAG: transglycosylase domain-containing protein, partial [Candidatus Dactylopiibacterium sp.]|nr:transglycosylase domain-containing protein [Candidatus Dactylopiibacterium sp.]
MIRFDPSRFQPLLRALLSRLRHPRRRDLLLGALALPALLLAYVLVLIPFTPAISDIRKAKSDRPSVVLSADGKPLAEFKWGNRDWVALKDISPRVVDALVATEDKRFFSHFGIDLRRTAGAALATLRGSRQGGSTITQQLARNLYPEEIGRSASLTRKLKEAITALKIEAVYSKQEILETYLNTVPFLYNAYGIDMAARTYFGKSARTLDVLESATLIGMLKGTSYYNPVLNPERALRRRNLVLEQMTRDDRLASERFDALRHRPLRLDFERQSAPAGPAPHFTQQLRKWLIDWADAHDYDIYADGLVIRTTIDSRLQTLASLAVDHQGRQLQALANQAWGAHWQRNDRLVETFVRESPEYRAALDAGSSPDDAFAALTRDGAFMRALREQKTRIQAGFTALDPLTGAIRAWVGSRGYEEDSYDHVQQARRQPGSTFKPFVYGAAFERGMKLDDTIIDQAVEIPLSGRDVWRPSDPEPPTDAPVTLRDGLAHSRNRITAQLIQRVGPERVARLAYALGVRQSKLDVVPSLALGTSPVSLLEMVSAYGSLANGGHYLAPQMVTRIEDRNGRVLQEFRPDTPHPALSAAATGQLLEAMRAVIDSGTGAAARGRFALRGDLAGKTGTTQDNTDGWFILMQPQLVGGAWVGFNDARITLRSNYWGQGAHSALPIVGDFFSRAMRERLVDTRARFPEMRNDGLLHRFQDWIGSFFAAPGSSEPATAASAPLRTAPPRPPAPAPAPAESAPRPE